MADKNIVVKKDDTKKSKKNIKKLPDIIAKGLSYLALVVFAAYGLRELLNTINQNVAYIFTGGVILLLVYIIFKE